MACAGFSNPAQVFLITIHLCNRLTIDLPQRRRDAEKDQKVFLCASAGKNITKQVVATVNAE
jgi:hypothetical protein